jgi:hypothetical protein
MAGSGDCAFGTVVLRGFGFGVEVRLAGLLGCPDVVALEFAGAVLAL